MAELIPELKAMVEAVQEKTGPRGGNLENPSQFPEWRQAPLRKERTPNGSLMLHRFEDTATVGSKNEQPWHRMAAMLMLAGVPDHKIAASAGVDKVSVGHLRAQRWFQELLAELAADEGEGILGLVRGQAQESLRVMIEIRDDTEAKPNVRLAAAQAIFEHSQGKAVQRVQTVVHRVSSDPEEELRQIQEELQALTKRS